MAIAVGVGACGLALYALCGVLQPAFARPRELNEREVAAAPNPVTTEFGGVARVLGFVVTPTTVEPGDAVWVTVYWQALARTDRDYAVFVHLLSDVGTMVAQRDTCPGLGSAPTTAWDPGVVFVDRYRVDVPESAYAPDVGYIQVGMYDPGGPRLATADGRDALRLAEVQVQPKPGNVPNALHVIFGGKVILAGYELDRRVVRPGETIHLTLYWRARKESEKGLPHLRPRAGC